MLDWFGRKLREMQEVKRDERGFTLIELLVVVIIIGILAAIAIPTFLGQRERAQDAQAQTSVRNAVTAGKSVWTRSQNYNTGVTVANLNTTEPSLTFAAAAIADTPNTIGYTGVSAVQATFVSCSASDTCFWIEVNENAASRYGTSAAPGTVPTNYQPNSFPNT